MKLIPCNLNELEDAMRVKNDVYPILTEFINSGVLCARLEDHSYKNANSAQASLWYSIHKWYDGLIRVVLFGDDVYLVRVN
jgi:hypothetical protein